MTHLENNYEEWKEIRARIDSIANAIFLITGGALSLSITVIVNAKGKGLIDETKIDTVVSSWYWLLATILIFLLLKGKMILQSYLLQFHTEFHGRWLSFQNNLGWLIGVCGFISFATGMIQMVNAAVLVLNT